jgi:phosphoserine phosphatase
VFPLLLFDLDGTLVDRAAMFRGWAAVRFGLRDYVEALPWMTSSTR